MKFFVKAGVQCEACDRRFEVELEAATECRGGYVVGGPTEYDGPDGWRFIGGSPKGWYCPDHWRSERRHGFETTVPHFGSRE